MRMSTKIGPRLKVKRRYDGVITMNHLGTVNRMFGIFAQMINISIMSIIVMFYYHNLDTASKLTEHATNQSKFGDIELFI